MNKGAPTKLLLVAAYPAEGSFTKGLTRAYDADLEKLGHSQQIYHLYRMGFRPDLAAAELALADHPISIDVAQAHRSPGGCVSGGYVESLRAQPNIPPRTGPLGTEPSQAAIGDTMSLQRADSVDHSSAPASAGFAGACWPKVSTPPLSSGDGALSMAGSVARYSQDREIYGEGDDARVFFKVVAGVVRTCKFLSDGRRQIDGFHVAGDVFGFEAGEEYRLSAEAVCDCTLICYRRRGLERLAANSTALSRQLFSYAIEGMARAQDHALMLGHRSAVEKVVGFLLEWAKQSPGGRTVALAMTRQDIADYLGLTIETVSRTLSQLERDAIIELPTVRQIRFTDPTALRELNA